MGPPAPGDQLPPTAEGTASPAHQVPGCPGTDPASTHPAITAEQRQAHPLEKRGATERPSGRVESVQVRMLRLRPQGSGVRGQPSLPPTATPTKPFQPKPAAPHGRLPAPTGQVCQAEAGTRSSRKLGPRTATSEPSGPCSIRSGETRPQSPAVGEGHGSGVSGSEPAPHHRRPPPAGPQVLPEEPALHQGALHAALRGAVHSTGRRPRGCPDPVPARPRPLRSGLSPEVCGVPLRPPG